MSKKWHTFTKQFKFEAKTLRNGNIWIAFALSIFVLIGFALAFEILPMETLTNVIKELINQSGPLGPLVFVAVFIMAVAIPPIPEHPLVLLAGLLFPLPLGVILTIFGAALGASVNFAIARKYGQAWVNKRLTLPRQLSKIKPLGTWPVMFFVRMFAGFTFDWYSYLLGILRIRWLSFLSATVLGITPGVIAEVYAGSFLTQHPLYTVIIGLVVLTISLLGYLVLSRLHSVTTACSNILSEQHLSPPNWNSKESTNNSIEE